MVVVDERGGRALAEPGFRVSDSNGYRPMWIRPNVIKLRNKCLIIRYLICFYGYIFIYLVHNQIINLQKKLFFYYRKIEGGDNQRGFGIKIQDGREAFYPEQETDVLWYITFHVQHAQEKSCR
jgi:hypothetical protein